MPEALDTIAETALAVDQQVVLPPLAEQDAQPGHLAQVLMVGREAVGSVVENVGSFLRHNALRIGATTLAAVGVVGTLGAGTAEAAKFDKAKTPVHAKGFSAQLKGPATVTELYSPVTYTLADTSGTKEGQVKIEVLDNGLPAEHIWHDNIKAKAKHSHKFTIESLPLATPASAKPKEDSVLIEAWNRQGKLLFKKRDEIPYSAPTAAEEPPMQSADLIKDVRYQDYIISTNGAFNMDPLQAHMDYNGLTVNGGCGTETTPNRPSTQSIVVNEQATNFVPCAWTDRIPASDYWVPPYPADFLQPAVEQYGSQALGSAEPYFSQSEEAMVAEVGTPTSFDASLTQAHVYFLSQSDESEVAAGGSPTGQYDLTLTNDQIPELAWEPASPAQPTPPAS